MVSVGNTPLQYVILLLAVLLQGVSFGHAYSDIPIPAPLKNRPDANPVSRADRMEKNMRLLTIMNLMQQKWELFGDYWYKLFEVELMWIPAENFCRELGGHLVSINDIAENDFVHKLRKKNNIWIGLNKVNSKTDIYNWSDAQ
uniref:C-type lectin domain-containing protein n=1 Tax=Panagrellus redivivus TaxID=6233 RepID=A0A7E4W6D3_PANRE